MDNADFLEPWMLSSAFWLSDAEPLFFADHAPTNSVSSSVDNALSSPSPSPNPNPHTPRSVQSITNSASDLETVFKRKRSSPSGPVNGRVSKRKPRPSKKSPTTYITADAANFQQMVQQATGVNFSSMSPLLKPQTKRIGASAAVSGPVHYCLPTLDTSAFLFDHHHHYQAACHGGAVDAQSGGAGKTCTPPDFDKLACFPTLDSWKVL